MNLTIVTPGGDQMDLTVDTDRLASIDGLLERTGLAGAEWTAHVDGTPVSTTDPLLRRGLLDGSVVVLRAAGDRTRPLHRPPSMGLRWPISSEGRLLLNRPPRPRPEDAQPSPEAPEPPTPPEAPPPIGWVSVLAPVPLSLVAAALLGPTIALFGLLGPALGVARWADGRLRHRRDTRRNSERTAQELEAHRRAEATHRAAERSRLARANPGPDVLVARTRRRSSRLWERRPTHDDFLVVSLGMGTGTHPLGPTPAAPLLCHLGDGPVGICGDPEVARALARWILAQVAVLHGPADVTISSRIGAEARSDWDWLKWLPHLAARREPVLEVVDSAPAGGGDLAVHVAASAAQLPSACVTTVAVRTDGTASIRGCATGELQVTTLGVEAAEDLARSLAPVQDPEAEDSTGVPDNVRLVELLDGSGIPSTHELSNLWRSAEPGGLPTILGVGPEGRVGVDLVADGPHALIAGTTGSGKSELLRTLVVASALVSGPEQLSFLLIDYKGGGTFDPLGDLPHTAGVVTDLDEGLADRVLVCLMAEIRRRELVLRSAGGVELSVHDRANPESRVGRLVVVVDEFATLAAQSPELLDSLVDVAQRGRSLGIHLVLATQRPTGVVDARIRANTNLRVALRVQDRSDSLDVIDRPDAAEIDSRCPGRAIVRVGSGEPVLFQSASLTVPCSERPDAAPFLLPEWQAPRARIPRVAAEDRDLAKLIETIAKAATESGMAPLPRPWLDPLPDSLTHDELARYGQPEVPGSLAIALVDEPERQCRSVRWWRPVDGGLLMYGGDDESVSRAVTGVVAGLGSIIPEIRPTVLDGGSGHLGRQVAAAGSARSVRLEDAGSIAATVAELAARVSRSVPPGAPRPVLVVHRYRSVVEALWREGHGPVADHLAAICRDGPGTGLVVVATADDERGIPHPVASRFICRLALSMVDAMSYAALGLDRRRARDLVGLRAVDVDSGHLVQLTELISP